MLKVVVGWVHRAAGSDKATFGLQFDTHHWAGGHAALLLRLLLLGSWWLLQGRRPGWRQQRDVWHEGRSLSRCCHCLIGAAAIARSTSAAAFLQQAPQEGSAGAHRPLRRDVLRTQQRRQQLLHVPLFSDRSRRCWRW